MLGLCLTLATREKVSDGWKLVLPNIRAGQAMSDAIAGNLCCLVSGCVRMMDPLMEASPELGIRGVPMARKG